MMTGDLLTLTQAAALAGVSPAALRQAVKRGRLRTIQPGREHLTTRQWVADYLAQRPGWAVRGAALKGSKQAT